MSEDTNFDQHSDRFRKNIYNTAKGQIRLKLILQDLNDNLPALQQNKKLNILDAGCGMGQVSLELAKQGHSLTLCDISSEMLNSAKENFEQQGYQAEFINTSAQQLDQTHNDKYDVIIFHAVLEWLNEPELIIPVLEQKLKPGGYLSLMFYNVNSIIFYNLLKGNFRKVMKQDFKGHPGGLTPDNPIDPEQLDQWLNREGFSVIKKTGIRVIYDYLSRELKANRSFEDILELENIYAHKSPFNMMVRYIHYICQKPDQ